MMNDNRWKLALLNPAYLRHCTFINMHGPIQIKVKMKMKWNMIGGKKYSKKSAQVIKKIFMKYNNYEMYKTRN